MLLPSNRAWLHFSVAALVVLFLDQVSKWQQVDLVTKNPGIGLGLAAEFISQQHLVILTLGVLTAVAFFAKSFWQQSLFASGVFLGGAVSNMFDRVVYGGVRDWLEVPGLGLRNNLADWAIFFGLLWLLNRSMHNKAKTESAVCA